MNKWLQSTSDVLLGFLRDSYTTPHNCPMPSFKSRCEKTYRYRKAGAGIAATKNEEKLLSFKEKHKGERCFIIGNGPSLNNLDLTLLRSEYTFGVNAIYTNFSKMGFYPTYYVVEDVFVAEDRADEINKYNSSVKFFGNYLNYCLQHDEQTVWLNVIFRYDEYKDFPKFSENAARAIWTGGTVSYLCLQLAYYMGFKEVYLVGFDHNYVIPKEAEVDGKDIVSTGDDVNHFSKEYFGKGKRWHDPMIDRMELAYKKAKKLYEADDRIIINATKGGKLEVFPRADYTSLF